MKLTRPVNIVRALVVFLGLAALGLYVLQWQKTQQSGEHLAFRQFIKDIDASQVASGQISGDTFEGKFVSGRGGGSFIADLPPDEPSDRAELIQELHNHGVIFAVRRPVISESVEAMLISFVLPPLLIMFLVVLGLRYLIVKLTGGPRPKIRGPRHSF